LLSQHGKACCFKVFIEIRHKFSLLLFSAYATQTTECVAEAHNSLLAGMPISQPAAFSLNQYKPMIHKPFS